MKRVGITMGDPCGIGPELVLGLLAKEETWDAHLHIYGSESLCESLCEKYGLDRNLRTDVHFHPCGPEARRDFFEKDAEEDRARLVLDSIEKATKDALEGRIDSLLTAPIDKKIVRKLVPTFTGHTGFLADLSEVSKTVMLLDNGELRVALLTEHIPLKDVASQITEENFRKTIEICRSGLKKYMGLHHPKIAVAGVNPHAGEIGDCPEDQVLSEAIETMAGSELDIAGPFSADSLFALGRGYSWDLLISPYHDQGLVAAKYPGLDKVVNITLGLPFLRTSPGHGVAYDRVGTLKVDHRSFRRAFDIALKGKIS